MRPSSFITELCASFNIYDLPIGQRSKILCVNVVELYVHFLLPKGTRKTWISTTFCLTATLTRRKSPFWIFDLVWCAISLSFLIGREIETIPKCYFTDRKDHAATWTHNNPWIIIWGSDNFKRSRNEWTNESANKLIGNAMNTMI